MASTEQTSTSNHVATATPTSARPKRLWIGGLLVALFWGVFLGLQPLDVAISTNFQVVALSSILLALSLSIWWLTNRGVSFTERAFIFLAILASALAVVFLSDPSFGGQGLVYLGLPVALTAVVAWLAVSRSWTPRWRDLGLLVVLAMVWTNFLVIRIDGIDGANQAAVRLRWRPSVEDAYLRERAKSASSAPAELSDASPLVAREGDWLDFRGPNRQGEWHGPAIATDWNTSPPKELWRRRIGPAWSSVLVVDGRLFTQEQRGEAEAVVCLDAETGRELWAREDRARFSDGQAGAGPRATPTFSDGQIYSFGATGVLNCLDAATGKRRWSRDIVADSGAPLPMWGFSASPLVVEDVVVVYGGAQPDKGLLAYKVEDGQPVWWAATGPVSYSSPQLAAIDGVSQVLLFSNQGLISVEPRGGKLLWQFEASLFGIWRVNQPRQLEGGAILIGCEDLGLLRIDVTHDRADWKATEKWRSRAMRPAYNDFVAADGIVYGFDEGIFSAVDAATGKRRWKAGRYGHGQVLLLADQSVLLVISEAGEAVLVAANRDKHEELGKFQAVTGKTWNHPVIAHGRLYVRNDQEMACFELSPASLTARAASLDRAARQ